MKSGEKSEQVRRKMGIGNRNEVIILHNSRAATNCLIINLFIVSIKCQNGPKPKDILCATTEYPPVGPPLKYLNLFLV